MTGGLGKHRKFSQSPSNSNPLLLGCMGRDNRSYTLVARCIGWCFSSMIFDIMLAICSQQHGYHPAVTTASSVVQGGVALQIACIGVDSGPFQEIVDDCSAAVHRRTHERCAAALENENTSQL